MKAVAVVVALLFVWLLDPTLGLINLFLQAIGVGKQGFFGDPNQAIASIAAVNIWRHMGYNAILIFAGYWLATNVPDKNSEPLPPGVEPNRA